MVMRNIFWIVISVVILTTINFSSTFGSKRDSLKVSNFKIYRVKDTLKVAFALSAKRDVIEKTNGLTLHPYIVGETKSVKLKPLQVKGKRIFGWHTLFKKSKIEKLVDKSDNNINITYLESVKLEDWMTKKSWLEVESISNKDFVVYMDRSKSAIDINEIKKSETSTQRLDVQSSSEYNTEKVVQGIDKATAEVKTSSVLQTSSVSSQQSGLQLKQKSTESTITYKEPKLEYSKYPFLVESSRLPEEYNKYEYLSEFGLPLYYEFNDLGINDYYKNNFVSLTKLYEALRKTLVKDRQKIKKVVIAGYSSPEGYTVINEDIAKRRGDMLKDRLCKVVGINPDIVEVVNGGENWSGLKSLVEKSSLKDKEDLLNIINYKIVLKEFNRIEDPINSDRERKMFDLNYSASYQSIKTNFFPLIRISYVVVIY